MKNRLMRFLISIALSAVLLWWAFHKVDIGAAWQSVANVRAQYVVLFVVALVVIQLCRILRWGVLVRPFASISLPALVRISNVGWMLIVLLPLRLGEFARPYLLKKESGAPLSAGLGSVAVERSVDGLLITLIFFVATVMLPLPFNVPTPLWVAGFVALGIFATAIAVIIGALVAGEPMRRLLRKLGEPISRPLTERALGMLGAFVSGLRALPDVRAIAAFVGLTLAYWVINGLAYYALMIGFGWDLPVVAGFMLVSVLAIGIMIPAGPGFLGTFQGAILAGLSIFGVGHTEAAAYGMVVYPVTLITLVAFGVPFLFGRGGQVAEIIHASTEAGH